MVSVARYLRQPTELPEIGWKWDGEAMGKEGREGAGNAGFKAQTLRCHRGDQQQSHGAPTVFLLFISGWIRQLKRSAPDTAPVSGPSR